VTFTEIVHRMVDHDVELLAASPATGAGAPA